MRARSKQFYAPKGTIELDRSEQHIPIRNRSHRERRGPQWPREQRGLYPMDAGRGDCARAGERMHEGFAGSRRDLGGADASY